MQVQKSYEAILELISEVNENKVDLTEILDSDKFQSELKNILFMLYFDID